MEKREGPSKYEADERNQGDCQERVLFLQMQLHFFNLLIDLHRRILVNNGVTCSGVLQLRLLGHARPLAPVLPLSDVGVKNVQRCRELFVESIQLVWPARSSRRTMAFSAWCRNEPIGQLRSNRRRSRSV